VPAAGRYQLRRVGPAGPDQSARPVPGRRCPLQPAI